MERLKIGRRVISLVLIAMISLMQGICALAEEKSECIDLIIKEESRDFLESDVEEVKVFKVEADENYLTADCDEDYFEILETEDEEYGYSLIP